MADEKPKFNLPKAEEKILKFWKENQIFEKTLARNKNKKTFVFYEGPPTANGMPHIGHALTRAFKDIILRYKTMRGFFVPRRAGWDTHGLPVEIEVEKQLGFKTKSDIEKYGIGAFNQKAKESVWRYKDEWEKATERLGFWVDLQHPYITYDVSYMETLWWIIKEFWKKKLLYQDFKVVPWCPRCGTGLSSHEVGLGYKKIRENSIYVRFKLKGKKNESLLVWTTTPWTLPANVAVAVNPKIEYTKFKIGDEYVWSAQTPPYEKDQHISVIEKVSGNKLLGLEYEPLYLSPEEYGSKTKPPFKVLGGDFVSTEEGTGMVHLAPAFGDEDMAVAKKTYGAENYPILHTVNADGTMKRGIIGEGRFAKDADPMIIEDLKVRHILWKVEAHEHEYPFCWRCGTALLYFAKNSWWVRTTAVKDQLLKNNETINWIPEHIKHGRLGEFLREVRDWAFSRERYWGTPLPVWKCEKCKHLKVLGSRDELAKYAEPSRNTYYIMRHGESVANIRNLTAIHEGKYELTPKGRKQVEKAAKILRNKNIDLIFASPIYRTKETAEIISTVVGKKAVFDNRLREINVGVFTGRPGTEYATSVPMEERFTKRPPQGENLAEVRARMMDFLEDLEKRFAGKTILIVSHEYPAWLSSAAAIGLSDEETLALRQGSKGDFIKFAEVRELIYKNLPRDEHKEVNLHRPYVDDFQVACPKCKSGMRRVPEVVDVWFDSGSMPFAQAHYPFAAKKQKTINNTQLPFPADYITEGVDQTRGWFYTLLTISTLLGKQAPYKNVISLGHVLDRNAQKMSKSKGNVVNPNEMIQKYGADALRWYFYTINAPGEPKRFDEKDLAAKLRGFLGTFWNSFLLFDTYVDKVKSQRSLPEADPLPAEKVKSSNVLDHWVLTRLKQVVSDTTKKLEVYDVTGGARTIEEFVIGDFSQWFLRRSRARFQHPQSAHEKEEAALTTSHVLLTLAIVVAPFAPFFAETLYQELKKKLGLKMESVHLLEWPPIESRSKNSSFVKTTADRQEARILTAMKIVRTTVTEALKLRAQAGIKVRQPLASLQIRNPKSEIRKELLELIKDEVNVKEISFGEEMKLDIVITPELKEEGTIREVVRNLQELRRDAGFKPGQKVRVQFSGTAEFETIVQRHKKFITEKAGAKEFVIGSKKIFTAEKEVEIEGRTVWIGIS